VVTGRIPRLGYPRRENRQGQPVRYRGFGLEFPIPRHEQDSMQAIRCRFQEKRSLGRGSDPTHHGSGTGACSGCGPGTLTMSAARTRNGLTNAAGHSLAVPCSHNSCWMLKKCQRPCELTPVSACSSTAHQYVQSGTGEDAEAADARSASGEGAPAWPQSYPLATAPALGRWQ